MTVDIRPFPRGEWSPLPYDGCIGVEGKVLVREDDFFVAMLRFAPDATIHEHAGPNDTIVVCLEGEGLTSVAGETSAARGRPAGTVAEGHAPPSLDGGNDNGDAHGRANALARERMRRDYAGGRCTRRPFSSFRA